MKYYSRLKAYKLSNVCLKIEPVLEATSYGWWVFVKRINGLVVFNEHRFSASTSKHQFRVRCELQRLNINVDLCVNTRCSLSDEHWIDSACDGLQNQIEALHAAIIKKGSRRAKNMEREIEIQRILTKIELLKRAFKTAA